MSLYLIIEISALVIPLIFSFDKNLQFYKNWKAVLLSFTITGLVFIPVDVYFTKHGIWGFNPAYHSNILLFHLPLEEWLFFLAIPYASVFLHYVLVYYFPNVLLGDRVTRLVSGLIILTLIIIVINNKQRIYTIYNSFIVITTIIVALLNKKRLINRFYLSFLVILIPFFLVNSVLTGSFIEGEVLMYNPSHILGIRAFTVPVEDIGYAFSLILLDIVLIEKFQTLLNSRSN